MKIRLRAMKPLAIDRYAANYTTLAGKAAVVAGDYVGIDNDGDLVYCEQVSDPEVATFRVVPIDAGDGRNRLCVDGTSDSYWLSSQRDGALQMRVTANPDELGDFERWSLISNPPYAVDVAPVLAFVQLDRQWWPDIPQEIASTWFVEVVEP